MNKILVGRTNHPGISHIHFSFNHHHSPLCILYPRMFSYFSHHLFFRISVNRIGYSFSHFSEHFFILFTFKVAWLSRIAQSFGVTALKVSEPLPCIILFFLFGYRCTPPPPPSYPWNHTSPGHRILWTSLLFHSDDCGQS